MDADLQRRLEAHHQRWWVDHVEAMEREDRRRAWRRRHPWLVRTAIGIGMAAWIGLFGIGGWAIADIFLGSRMPQTINIHLDAPLVAPQH